MSGVFAEALTQEEVAAIEAELGVATSTTNLPPMIGGARKPSSNSTISYDELLAFRELEVPLNDYWVYVTNGENRGRVPATKVNKWLGLGYTAE